MNIGIIDWKNDLRLKGYWNKRGIGRPRKKLMDWMMEDGYGHGNSRKRHNIEKSGVVGHLDLPGDDPKKK